MDLPLVSIVTPSYNAAGFLEETIQSVLSQDYPRIEYIVMDGGSTDGTLDILHKYQGRLQYRSEPDHGQADAINKGFKLSRGSVFAFLCADDTYLPGAVGTAVRHLQANPGYAGIYGEGHLTDETGKILCRYPTLDFDSELLKNDCFICQPASFLWRDAFLDTGMMDVNLQLGLDYDFWIRLAQRHTLLKVNDYLATSRMHRGAKTLRDRSAVFKASIDILEAHYRYAPYTQIYGYCSALLDPRDGFFEPVRQSPWKYVLAVLYGSVRNFRHLPRYWKECVGEATVKLKSASPASPRR